MQKATVRALFTVLMYAGIMMFLYPYVTGRISQGVLFLILGAGLAVTSGMLRCLLTDGDCKERYFTHKIS